MNRELIIAGVEIAVLCAFLWRCTAIIGRAISAWAQFFRRLDELEEQIGYLDLAVARLTEEANKRLAKPEEEPTIPPTNRQEMP